jgi:hypothetical protein
VFREAPNSTVHSEHGADTLNNDIALIRLPEPVAFTRDYSTVFRAVESESEGILGEVGVGRNFQVESESGKNVPTPIPTSV